MKILTNVDISEFFDKSNPIDICIGIIGILIAIVAVIACIESIILAIKYLKFNRKKNACGLKGKEIARKILDHYGLTKIKVKYSGSLIFGNSYSHYFKKVRLRRISFNKKSVSAMAMATQKSCLAILDKENDPDMRKRVKLVPFITFGPFLFVPLVVIGLIVDLIVLNTGLGITTLVCLILATLLYVYAFVLALKVLKTEKKAQKKALTVARELNIARNQEELDDMKTLFDLYNKQYVLDIILAFLEMLRFILQIVSVFTSNNGIKIGGSNNN